MMHQTLKILLFLFLLGGAAGARELTPAAVLDDVLRKPGDWGQMCSIADAKPRQNFPLYGYRRDWSTSYISVAQFKRLRGQREGVVRVIYDRLEAAIPKQAALAQKEGRPGARPGEGGEPKLESYLLILLDLNGVEALKGLLDMEAAMDKVATYGVKDPTEQESPERTPRVYLRHAQVLSVISAILVNEKVPGAKGMKSPAPYDRVTRNRIVDMARGYLKHTSPAHYIGAGGMGKSVDR